MRAGTFEVILLRRLGRPRGGPRAPRLLASRGPHAAPPFATRRVKLGGHGRRALAPSRRRSPARARGGHRLHGPGRLGRRRGAPGPRLPDGRRRSSPSRACPCRSAIPRSRTTAATAARRAGHSGRADFDAASSMSTTYVFPQRAWTLPVLQRAVAVNPGDATAHFLLGSLYLSGGIADRAVAEWQEARRLEAGDPGPSPQPGPHPAPRPGPDGGAPARSSPKGVGADPDNAEVYQGARPGAGPSRPAGRRARARARGLSATRTPARAPSSSSAPWPSSRPAGSPKPRPCSPGASSLARSSARTCGRSGWRWRCRRRVALARGGDCAARPARDRGPGPRGAGPRLHQGRASSPSSRARAPST